MESSLKTLITNYINEVDGILKVSVSDREGNIITSMSREDLAEIIEFTESIIRKEVHELSADKIEKQSRKKRIRVICPNCKGAKSIFVPQDIFKKATNIVILSIPKGFICQHHFQVFVDKNYAVRGYQKVDYEIDGVLDKFLDDVREKDKFFNIISTEDKKIVCCTSGPKSILTTIAIPSKTDIELKVYSEYVAEKVELLLDGEEKVSLEIPDKIKILSKTRTGKLPKGNFSVKVVMTGDFQVGKTSIMRRFVEGEFQDPYFPTVGINVMEKTIHLDDTHINLSIWDISGQRFQMLPYRKKFYSEATSALIIVDLSRPKTLINAEIWYNDIKQRTKTDIPIILVGNKIDLIDLYKEERRIFATEKEVKKLAEKLGSPYVITSAKTGENINDAFLYATLKFLEL